jgi:hypothetical protein
MSEQRFGPVLSIFFPNPANHIRLVLPFKANLNTKHGFNLTVKLDLDSISAFYYIRTV